MRWTSACDKDGTDLEDCACLSWDDCSTHLGDYLLCMVARCTLSILLLRPLGLFIVGSTAGIIN
jgi:hypothetical protein